MLPGGAREARREPAPRSSSTVKQQGPMLGPTTAPSRRPRGASASAALPTMPAIIPRQPACTAARRTAIARRDDDDRHAVRIADRRPTRAPRSADRRGRGSPSRGRRRRAPPLPRPPRAARAVNLTGHDEPLRRTPTAAQRRRRFSSTAAASSSTERPRLRRRGRRRDAAGPGREGGGHAGALPRRASARPRAARQRRTRQRYTFNPHGSSRKDS